MLRIIKMKIIVVIIVFIFSPICYSQDVAGRNSEGGVRLENSNQKNRFV